MSLAIDRYCGLISRACIFCNSRINSTRFYSIRMITLPIIFKSTGKPCLTASCAPASRALQYPLLRALDFSCLNPIPRFPRLHLSATDLAGASTRCCGTLMRMFVCAATTRLLFFSFLPWRGDLDLPPGHPRYVSARSCADRDGGMSRGWFRRTRPAGAAARWMPL